MGIRLPLKTEAFEEPSVADRLLGRTPAQHAFAKAKNAVIAGEFDAALIRDLAAASGVDILGTFHDRWVALLEDVVVALGSDARYDGVEKELIARYVKAFAIRREEAEGAVAKASRRIYLELVRRAVSDGELTDADRDALMAAAKRLSIGEADVNRLASEAIQPLVEEMCASLRDDGLVTDEEWNRFTRTLRQLSVVHNPNHELFAGVALAHERWRVLHGAIEPHECSDLTLQKGEEVFFRGEADWHEYRKVRQRVDYGGLAGRFRIARGLSFRYGSIGYRAPSVDELKLIRSGDLVMTNRRVILLSAIGDNKSIRWNAVVRVSMESHNTFELEKATGKSPVIDVKDATIGHRFLAGQLAYRLLELSAG